MARASTNHGNGAHHSHTSHKGRSNGSHRSTKSGSRRGRRGSSINPQWLKDFLSEMLAVEKGGVQLYQKALNELEHSELEDRLNEFLNQTQRHVELCTEMLEAAGGDENYQSPGAAAAEHKAEGLMSTQVPPEMIDLNNIENLVLAETKDHWNWETLASIARRIDNDELKRMALKAVSEVRKQEKTHLSWNEETLSKLAMESAMRAPAEAMDEDEKESQSMTDRDKGTEM
jgi:rubrerythrin